MHETRAGIVSGEVVELVEEVCAGVGVGEVVFERIVIRISVRPRAIHPRDSGDHDGAGNGERDANPDLLRPVLR